MSSPLHPPKGPSPGFELISTTKYDPQLRDITWNTDANAGTPSPYLLLRYHHRRLLDAAEVHGWPLSPDFSTVRLKELCGEAAQRSAQSRTPEHSFRIRILLSFTGTVSVTATPIPSPSTRDPAALSLWLPSVSPTPPTPSSDWLILHLDTEPTSSSLFTRTKTTRREHYTAARDRFNIPPPPTSSPDEVLLFNEDGDITETSIRNVAFVRRSPPCWVTPPASSGCLPGVMRRWLLEKGRIIEADVGELRRDQVVDGEYVLTFNGVEGCRIGRVTIGA
ncbi:aminotransferase [Trametes elegans]|nr:aminotransferase [Trametes elegans]